MAYVDLSRFHNMYKKSIHTLYIDTMFNQNTLEFSNTLNISKLRVLGDQKYSNSFLYNLGDDIINNFNELSKSRKSVFKEKFKQALRDQDPLGMLFALKEVNLLDAAFQKLDRTTQRSLVKYFDQISENLTR